MKTRLLFIVAMLVTFGMNAQKIKLTEGNTNFLKGQDVLGITFTYDENLKIGPGTEAEYMEKKMTDAEEDEPGGGEAWKKAWYADRTEHFQPKFIYLFEKGLAKKEVVLLENDENAKYTMIVNTTFIEPGFNVGMASKKAEVSMNITFVETANPQNVMAVYTILKSPGTAMYDLGARVGESYAKAAKELAKLLLKEKAF
jgi:hypothetical protein